MYLFLHYLLHQHNRLLKELCDIKAFEQRWAEACYLHINWSFVLGKYWSEYDVSNSWWRCNLWWRVWPWIAYILLLLIFLLMNIR
jgi:hypothetical protein